MDKEKITLDVQPIEQRERPGKPAGRSAAGRSGSASGRSGSAAQARKKKRRRKRKPGLAARGARALSRMQHPGRFIGAIAAVLLLLIVVLVVVKNTSVSHKTPESVTKALVEAYVNGNESKIKKCYGVKKADDALQQEMDAKIAYFKVFSATEVTVDDCGIIYQDGDYSYVYIVYELALENKQAYPCIATYMTQKNDKDKYYVLTSSEITDEMSSQAAEKYTLFMKTDAYKDYQTAYDAFIKKNPGYEDKIASKLS